MSLKNAVLLLFKKAGKYLLRLLIIILSLLIITVFLLQVPVVQQYTADKLTAFLREKLKTEVRIESFRLRLPESLVLKGVYFEDLQQDTLFSLGELSLNFQLTKLLRRKIGFNKLSLKDGVANLHFKKDGSSNLDFILDAFGVAGPADSLPPDKIPPSSPGWQLTFDDATLDLQRVHFKYSDEKEAFFLDVLAGSLTGGVDKIDFDKNSYLVKELKLANSRVSLEMGDTPPDPVKEQSEQDYTIEVKNLEITSVHFDLKRQDLVMSTNLEKLKGEGGAFRLLNEDMNFRLAGFQAWNSDLKYDVPSAAALSGFDTQHFHLNKIGLEIAEFDYHNLEISGDIKQFSMQDVKGFVLKNLQAQFAFSKDGISLEDFVLQTNSSDIQSRSTHLKYPFLSETPPPLDNLRLTTDLSANGLSTADIQYFYPAAGQFGFFQKNPDALINIEAKADGTLRNLNIGLLNINAPGTRLSASGQLRNILDSKNPGFDLTLHELETTGKTVTEWLPKGTLPDSLSLPDHISLKGKITGTLQKFSTQLDGRMFREAAPSPTRIVVTATVSNITDLNRTVFDVKIDTLFSTRSDLLAYIPPGSLPAHVTLPETVLLSGTASGKLADLQSDLKLQVVRDGKTSEVSAKGNIRDLSGKKPSFDIALQSANFNREELLAYIPDSLLPSYFIMPVIKKLSGTIRGNADAFETKLQFEANTGSWAVDGSLKNEAYDVKLGVQNLQLEEFFEKQFLDSMVRFRTAPWMVELSLKGQGLNVATATAADVTMNIRKAGAPENTGISVIGKLENKIFRATASASEPEINLQSDLEIDYTTDIPKTVLSLTMNKLDLYSLGQAGRQFYLSGDVKALVYGFSMDTLSGTVLIDKLGIQYDSTFYEVDSLLVAANFDESNKQLDVTSDLFDAHLKGQFRYPQVVDIIRQQFDRYFSKETPEALVGTTEDRFDFDFSLHRPEVFTTGIITGLENLAPFNLTASFDNRKPMLDVQTAIPYLSWQGAILDTFSMEIRAGLDSFQYQFGAQNIDYQTTVSIPDFRAFGSFDNRTLTTNFQIFNLEQQKRFDIKAFLETSGKEDFTLRLDPEQLFNYETWQATPGNRIVWSKDSLVADDWRLHHEDESLAIEDVRNEKLVFHFNNFDLRTISDLIQPDSNYLGGIVNGDLMIANSFKITGFQAQLKVDSLIVRNGRLGDLQLKADNPGGDKVNATLQLNNDVNDLKLAGTYGLGASNGKLDFQLDINSLNLASVQALTMGFIDKSEGILKGHVYVGGTFEKPSLKGEMNFNDAAFEVKMLSTRLRLGDEPIVFNSDIIEFKDLKIYDEQNHEGTISSYIQFKNLQDLVFNTVIKMKDFQVLETGPKDNSVYYGRLRVDADAKLTGSLSNPEIDIIVKPKKGSDLTYVYTVLSMQLESHTGIVEFIDPVAGRRAPLRRDQLLPVSEDLNMRITIRMTVTDDMKIKVIIDPITGDYFEGQAKGDLVYVQFPDGRMVLTGVLEVVKGEYLYTYQGLVKRKFEVQAGSMITWIGDPFTPKLDLNVRYEARTSPYPLVASQQGGGGTESTGLTQRQTFYVTLKIGGTPEKTEISTEIEYPTGEGNTNNADVSAAIQSVNRDPSQQNTQAFALILFNGFIAPGAGGSDFQLVDLQGNVNSLITQQLNNLANRYVKFVELDFGLDSYSQESGSTVETQTDFRVSIKKRFLNDRLAISIDGKTSTESGTQQGSSQTYLDNITVEYALTSDGRFKIKVYNKQDFDDFIGSTGLKMGGAFVFSRDFNSIRLKRR